MQTKNIALELKDVNSESRTAVIAHAVYNNIDRTKDVSRKGMFQKSWNESKSDISFYLNHDPSQAPGKVVDVYEDEGKAYTEVKLGTHTLGEDTLRMMLEGTIKSASFGYIAVRSNNIEVKGIKVRELVECKHLETSVLTMMPANPAAGIVSVVKSLGNEREVLKKIEFIKQVLESNATEEQKTKALVEVKYLIDILSGLDTVGTHDDAPPASDFSEDIMTAIQLLKLRA